MIKLKKKTVSHKEEISQKWFPPEGELAIDFYQTEKEIIVRAAVAGVKSKDIEVTVENDILVIKGLRDKPAEEEGANFFLRECYWGKFSRRIVITDEIDASRIAAEIKEGILIIRIPRITRESKKPIKVKELE